MNSPTATITFLFTDIEASTLLSNTHPTTPNGLLPSSLPLTDLGTHPLKDMPQPERIYLLPYPGMPSELSPLRTLPTSVHNQPQQLTRFVGREQEIEEWNRLIHSRSRRL